MMIMMKLGLLLLGLVETSAAAGPGSCLGRCGEVFFRGQQCTCDTNCHQHKECCPDFEVTCNPAQSCQGRCGESFTRGKLCECDPMCSRYNTCCHDYQLHCDATVTASHHGSSQSLRAKPSRSRKSEKNRKKSNSESEEAYTDGSNIPAGMLPIPSSTYRAPQYPAADHSLPSRSALPLGSRAPVSPANPGAAAGKLNIQLLLSPGGVSPSGPRQGVNGPAGSRPSTLQDVVQALGLSAGEGGSEGTGAGFPADVDLCSDSPINGLTALINGAILIFKGEFFWSIDPVSGSVGRPQNITVTLGISPPIDSVFTRSNCKGDTYIIKGDQCWRLDENMMMQPGFPKPLAHEFPGLTGSISAVLAVPATKSRPETLYFFKNGGDTMQKFTFPPESTPSCRENPRSSMKKSLNRPAEVLLSGEINIKVSLKGFPTPITSALSMPSPQGSDGYLHFVFSGPLFFRVQISGDLPALFKPNPSGDLAPLPIISPAVMATNPADMAGQDPSPPHPINSMRYLLGCP